MKIEIDEYRRCVVSVPIMRDHAREIIARAKAMKPALTLWDEEDGIWAAFEGDQHTPDVSVTEDALCVIIYLSGDALDHTMQPTEMSLDERLDVARIIRKLI